MSQPASTSPAPTDDLVVPRRRWIDALLLAAAVVGLATDLRLIALPLLIMGTVLPAFHWRASRRRHGAPLRHRVPDELATAHANVVAAAALAGVPDGPAIVAAADDLLLEVAAVLGGRPPRGAAQARFVAARVDALDDAARNALDWHHAWIAARDEVEALSAVDLPEEAARPRSGALVGVFMVVLLPVLVGWEVLRGVARLTVALGDGLALRARTACRLVVRAMSAAVRLLAAVGRRWSELRRAVVESAAEARARLTTRRALTQLRMRRRLRAWRS